MASESDDNGLDKTRSFRIPAQGTVISHYKIIEKIGEGGMGVVYKAEDTKLKRTVALKFLPPELTRDAEAKERFVREARAASALDHPNVCTVYEIDEADGHTFISMACIEGQNLKDKIRSGRLELSEALYIAFQVALGLQAAHEKGIFHRDLKSGNVMITPKGQAKILDFGLAKSPGGATITRSGTTMGTPAYMSPEQARGEPVDHRTDIWSLGVVLYEMVTGEMPFKGGHEQAVIYSILNVDPEPITNLRSDLPTDLERVVERAMAKHPDERYPRVEEMLADLKSVREGLDSGPTKTLAARAKPSPSIAVLPFVNMSPEKENEYFSDGVTEDIIAQLSKIGDLKVISRTSIMRYKSSDKSLREIGKELGVATILEGSVRRAENRVRIVGQLVDARTDEHIWAETYDRELRDIFEIQSDVAQKIASALKAKISPAEKERLEKRPTQDLTAYDYYLKGLDYYSRYRKQDNEIAIEFFRKACKLDPKYALAYAGLGDAYAQRTLKFGFAQTSIDSAIEVSKKAISIDPDVAEAHKALGLAYMVRGWFRRALEANRKAVELKPNCFPAVGNIGWIHWSTGEFSEAMAYAKRARALNPTSVYRYLLIGSVYLMLDDLAQAEEWFGRTLELQPDFLYTHVGLIDLYLRQGKHHQVIEHRQRILSLSPGDVRSLETSGDVELLSGNYVKAKERYEKAMAISSKGLRGLTGTSLSSRRAYVYWKTGRKGDAEKMFSQSLEEARKRLEQRDESWEAPYDIAAINAIQGNKKEAYLWLQKAIEAGWREYRSASRNPQLESLHHDGQFKRMMERIRARIDEMRKRVEEREKK